MKTIQRWCNFNTGWGIIKMRLVKIRSNEFSGIPMRYAVIPLDGIEKVILPKGYYFVNSDLPTDLTNIRYAEQCSRSGLTQFICVNNFISNGKKCYEISSKHSYWNVETMEE